MSLSKGLFWSPRAEFLAECWAVVSFGSARIFSDGEVVSRRACSSLVGELIRWVGILPKAANSPLHLFDRYCMLVVALILSVSSWFNCETLTSILVICCIFETLDTRKLLTLVC